MKCEFIIESRNLPVKKISRHCKNLKMDIWQRGNLTPKLARPIKASSIEIQAGLEKSYDMQEHLESIFQKLKPYKTFLKKYCKKSSVLIRFYGFVKKGRLTRTVNNRNYDFVFDKNIMKEIAYYNASMEFCFNE